MPQFKVYDWLCTGCGQKEERLVDVSAEHWDSSVPCPACGCKSNRAPSGPPVQNVSLVDGTKRKGFEDIKHIARLEVNKAALPPNKRHEIEKEISARRSLK